MSYKLDGTTIKTPTEINENYEPISNTSISLNNYRYKDIVGTAKKSWTLYYRMLSTTDFDVLKTIYDSHITDADIIPFVSDETNLTINTNVYMSFGEKKYIKGGDYYSEISIILVEV